MRPSFRTLAYVVGEFAAVAILLFVVRFVLRGHLVLQWDEECTLGGVAVDLLAHGVRFHLPVYAPNDYENGFFYSGILTAGSFSVLGRNVLALKAPTHLIVSMGAVATLWLLRSCLDELRLQGREVRWTAIATLIVATALSPRLIASYSTCAVGIGSHIEGAAIDVILLAVFARCRASWSATATSVFWAVMGVALYVNKGTLLLALVLAVVELNLARSSPRRLIAAGVGFVLGSIPALVTMASGNTGRGGWDTIGSKLLDHVRNFPFAFVSTVLTLADHRAELLATWTLAITVAVALTLRHANRRRSSAQEGIGFPIAAGATVGLLLLHVAALGVMAQGGFDVYANHVYPPLVVATAILGACICSAASRRWGVRGGGWTAVMIVGSMVVVHRPNTLTPSFSWASALWSNRGGAACSWRFAEAFLRLPRRDIDGGSPDGSAPDGDTSLEARQRRAIALCRSLSEVAQVLDCIGGVARDLQYGGGKIEGEPPPSLIDVERRAFAFYYGVRRFGRTAACDDFREPALRQDCRTAAQLDCFNLVDASLRLTSGDSLPRPRCEILPPPMDGYFAEIRSDLLSRPSGGTPKYAPYFSRDSMGDCQALVHSCY